MHTYNINKKRRMPARATAKEMRKCRAFVNSVISRSNGRGQRDHFWADMLANRRSAANTARIRQLKRNASANAHRVREDIKKEFRRTFCNRGCAGRPRFQSIPHMARLRGLGALSFCSPAYVVTKANT